MQKVEVHSTDPSGGNIIPGREDGNNDIGNGSTYQIFRNAAATNSGSQQYFAKDKDGVVEPITGPGGSGGQLYADITFNAGTSTLTATVSGGTPSTYAWTVKSTSQVTGRNTFTYNGATNASTAVINVGPGTQMGLAEVTVTDTLGRKVNAYYYVELVFG